MYKQKKTRAVYLWTATGNEIEEARTAIVREDDAMEYDDDGYSPPRASCQLLES